MRRAIVFGASLAILPTIVQAQGRGMMPAMARPAVVAPRVVMPRGVAHVAAPTGRRFTSGTRVALRSGVVRARTSAPMVRMTPRSNTATTTTTFDNDLDDFFFAPDFTLVPGLGFDFPHLAAIEGARHRLPLFGFFPFFNGGGFFLPMSSPVIIEEAPAPESAPPENPEPEAVPMTRRARPVEVAPVYSAQAAPPGPSAQPEAEEYVFVRRDGTVFFAVAYAWENDTLRYITREGMRRSLTRDALDLGATQQFNEQRGLIFHLPT